jgi:hypothetical protein
MYYTTPEIAILENSLSLVKFDDRKAFFMNCLRLRRRERNLWEDTPLAKIFCPQEEWHLLRANATLQLLVTKLSVTAHVVRLKQ